MPCTLRFREHKRSIDILKKKQCFTKIHYTVVECTLNQRNLNLTDTFCVMQKKKKTKNIRLLQYKSRLDKHGSSYRGKNYKKNDLKGNENCCEIAGGSSYRGFEFSRVKLQ